MNWSAEDVALVPPAVVRVMSIVPAEDTGDVTTQEVVVQLCTVAENVPNNAVVAPDTKPVPVTVTAVPPAAGPPIGVIPVTVGTAS
jgi:hypothetical protein